MMSQAEHNGGGNDIFYGGYYATSYICVDAQPEAYTNKFIADNDGNLLYYTGAACSGFGTLEIALRIKTVSLFYVLCAPSDVLILATVYLDIYFQLSKRKNNRTDTITDSNLNGPSCHLLKRKMTKRQPTLITINPIREDRR